MSNWYEMAKFADGQWTNVGLEEFRTNQDLRSKAIEMAQRGVSRQQISRNLGISLTALDSFRISPSAFGIDRKVQAPKQITQEDIDNAVSMYRKGNTINQIAVHLNVSHQTLLPILLKALEPEERARYRIKILERKSPEDISQIVKIMSFKIQNPSMDAKAISKATGQPYSNIKRILEAFYSGNNEDALFVDKMKMLAGIGEGKNPLSQHPNNQNKELYRTNNYKKGQCSGCGETMNVNIVDFNRLQNGKEVLCNKCQKEKEMGF